VNRRGVGFGAAGLVTGAAGLAASFLVASIMGLRVNPVVGVGEAVIELTPGSVAERAIQAVGHLDKPLLVTGVLLFLAVASYVAGRLAARSDLWPTFVFVVMAGVAAAAVLSRPNAKPTDVIPVIVGGLVWIALLPPLTSRVPSAPVEPESRRRFLLLLGGVVAGSAVVGVLGRVVGQGRRHVEAARALLRLPITRRDAPAGAAVGLEGIEPWVTPNDSFYQIHTALVVPAVDPGDWRLRIHGMVDRELTYTYQDLLDREITQSWITLNCVSNPVGGDLIGNAWWSGVRIADLLAEAGPQAGADAIKQTSHDGWTCGTPLGAVTDAERGAMLAIGMNGQPLPIEHGFPVRMIVPGLYGFVSATKWLVDIEVTRFADFKGYWSTRGWSEQAPVKLASRIDVPRYSDNVPAGSLRVGGSAWQQYVGIAAVEFQLDGGPWQSATLGTPPTDSTWVQWSGTVSATPGHHSLRVRATSKDGETQTPVVARPDPDGATGWHTIEFTAT
jgi:DMSO/TMAO reductase YedYZ molybdopterin-dependent catalytic subunit